jgi:Domain of unknown function (DUF5103)
MNKTLLQKSTHSFFILLLSVSSLFAQGNNTKNSDYTYQDNIFSVLFFPTGYLLSKPIIELEGGATLTLMFDELDSETHDYRYSVTYCNADWTPTVLEEMEYLSNFSHERITDFKPSFNTAADFTNYRLTIPNSSVSWTKSGNYLLHVYSDDDDKKPILTRRFMVVERKANVKPTLVHTALPKFTNTHQEIDFAVRYENFQIRNPRSEVQAVVMQNGRWDNAITNLRPQFLYDKELSFDYQNEILFPGGKEFRWADFRNLRTSNERVQRIESYKNSYDVTLRLETPRDNKPYFYMKDANGEFLIENKDGSNINDHNLECDYAKVLFSLEKYQPYEEGDVYVVGRFNDFQLTPSGKMVYDATKKAYFAEIFCKQGRYDYMYAFVKKGTTKLDLTEIEGDWYETENEYNILVYYRAFGSRFDRLIAAHTFNTAISK